MSRGDIQEEEYRFPYHWIPAFNPSWTTTRRLEWGYEYLGTMQAVLDAVGSLSPERVLDFGCGDGRLACELSARGIPEVVGVDLSPAAIAFAQAFGRHCETPPVFHCGPLSELSVAPRFDVCVAMEVLEHIPERDIAAVVSHIHEQLRPGGSFVVTVPTLRRTVHPKHYRHYDVQLLVGQLAAHFELREVRYLHRVGRSATMVRRVCHNRLFDTASNALLRRASAFYRRRIQFATEATGAHLLATFRARKRTSP